MEYSILMSVYYKEDPEYFKLAIDSMLNQTIKSNDFVIVCDGPLTKELYDVLNHYEANSENHIHRVQLDENQGLGIALQKGVLECKNELIARMDSDDIAVYNRIEIQLNEFEIDSDLIICGGYIEEFNDDPFKGYCIKRVPIKDEQIKEYVKKRNPFNHMTVVFKKSAILNVGNYQPFHLNEDYYLWIKLIKNAYKCKNVDEILVKMRAGNNMYKRRGGINYIKSDIRLQKYLLSIGLINKKEEIINMISRGGIRLCPTKLRKKLYLTFLRKEGDI